jgi:hypothetical protein
MATQEQECIPIIPVSLTPRGRTALWGGVLAGAGVVIRFSSHALAWCSYISPNMSSTEPTVAALNEIGMGCFYLGGLLLVGRLLIAQYKHED